MSDKTCAKCGAKYDLAVPNCGCGSTSFVGQTAPDPIATPARAAMDGNVLLKTSTNTLWFFTFFAALIVALSLFNNANGSDGSSAATAAISDFRANDESSTTVYQQQVNALWATKDLLKVIADQNSTMIHNQAVIVRSLEFLALLLGLLIAGLVRGAFLLQSKKRQN
jgi:preprotein translocase subunit SecG